MENFGLNDVVYFISVCVGIVATFFVTKHNLKEYVRDRVDNVKEEISQLKLKIKDLEAKDSLQQQVLDQIGKQTADLVPKLLAAIEKKQHDAK